LTSRSKQSFLLIFLPNCQNPALRNMSDEAAPQGLPQDTPQDPPAAAEGDTMSVIPALEDRMLESPVAAEEEAIAGSPMLDDAAPQDPPAAAEGDTTPQPSSPFAKPYTDYKSKTPASVHLVQMIECLKEAIADNPANKTSAAVRIQSQRLFDFYLEHMELSAQSIDFLSNNSTEAQMVRQVLMEEVSEKCSWDEYVQLKLCQHLSNDNFATLAGLSETFANSNELIQKRSKKDLLEKLCTLIRAQVKQLDEMDHCFFPCSDARNATRTEKDFASALFALDRVVPTYPDQDWMCSLYEVGINPDFIARALRCCLELYKNDSNQRGKITPDLARRAWNEATCTPKKSLSSDEYNYIISEGFGEYLQQLCGDDYLDIVLGFTQKSKLKPVDIGVNQHPTVEKFSCLPGQDGKVRAGAYVLYNAFSETYHDQLFDGINKLRFMVGEGNSQGRLLRVAGADPADLCPLVIGNIAYQAEPLEGIEEQIHLLANQLAEGVNGLIEKAASAEGLGFVECRYNLYLMSVEQITKAVFKWHSDADPMLHIDVTDDRPPDKRRDQRLPLADEMFVGTVVLSNKPGVSAKVQIDPDKGKQGAPEVEFNTTHNCIWFAFGIQKYAYHQVVTIPGNNTGTDIRLAITFRLSITRKNPLYFERLRQATGAKTAAELVSRYRKNYNQQLVLSQLSTSSTSSACVGSRKSVPQYESALSQILPESSSSPIAAEAESELTYNTLDLKTEPYTDGFATLPYESYLKVQCNSTHVRYNTAKTVAQIAVKHSVVREMLKKHIIVREKQANGTFVDALYGSTNPETGRCDLLLPGTELKAHQVTGDLGIKHSSQRHRISSGRKDRPRALTLSRQYKNGKEVVGETHDCAIMFRKEPLTKPLFEQAKYGGEIKALGEGGAPVIEGTDAPDASCAHKSDGKVEFPSCQDRHSAVNSLLLDDYEEGRVLAVFLNSETFFGKGDEDSSEDGHNEVEKLVFLGYYYIYMVDSKYHSLDDLKKMYPNATTAEQVWLRCRSVPYWTFHMKPVFSTEEYRAIHRSNLEQHPYKCIHIDSQNADFMRKLYAWVHKNNQQEALGFGTSLAVDESTVIEEWIKQGQFRTHVSERAVVNASESCTNKDVDVDQSPVAAPRRQLSTLTCRELMIGDALVNVAAAMRYYGDSVCTKEATKLYYVDGRAYIEADRAEKRGKRSKKRAAAWKRIAAENLKRRKLRKSGAYICDNAQAVSKTAKCNSAAASSVAGAKRKISQSSKSQGSHLHAATDRLAGKVPFTEKVFSRPIKHKQLGLNLRRSPMPASNRTLDLNTQYIIGWAFSRGFWEGGPDCICVIDFVDQQHRNKLKDACHAAILSRTTGRLKAMHTVCLGTFFPGRDANSVESFLAEAAKTLKSKHDSMLAAQWVSKIHQGQIPDDLNVFSNWCNFVRKIAREIGPMIDNLLDARSRGECTFAMAKTAVAKLISDASSSPEHKNRWLAQQVIFDVYELFNDETLFGIENAADIEQGPGAAQAFQLAINAGLYCAKPLADDSQPKGKKQKKAPSKAMEYQRFLKDSLNEMESESLPVIFHQLSGRYRDANNLLRHEFNHRRVRLRDQEHPHCKLGIAFNHTLSHYDCSVQPKAHKPGLWPDRMPNGPFVRSRVNRIMRSIRLKYLDMDLETLHKLLPHPECILMFEEEPPTLPAIQETNVST